MKPTCANNETIMLSGADRLSVRTKLLLTNGFFEWNNDKHRKLNYTFESTTDKKDREKRLSY